MSDEKTWLCPICALRTFKYGKGCPDGETCENRKHAHATGQFYLSNEERKEAESIGISRISDEE